MFNRLSAFFRFIRNPMIGASGVAPLGFLLYARFVPILLPWAWVYPALYGIIVTVCQSVPAAKRRLTLVSGMIVFMIIGIYLLIRETYFCVIFVPFCAAILLLLQMLEAGSSIQSYLCIALHIIAQITVAVSQTSDSPVYDPVILPLTGFLFVFLFLSMISMNRDNLKELSLGKLKVPQAMIKKHRIMTLALFFGTLLLSLIPTLASGILKFLKILLLALGKGLHFLMKLLSGGESETPDPIPQESVPTDWFPQGGNTISHNFEDILVILLVIGVILFGFVFLWSIMQGVLRKIRTIWQRMNQISQDEESDYQDEITETRPESEKKRHPLLSGLRRRNREKSMTPAEQIRFRYQKLLRKHRDWGPGVTAREKLPEQAAALYERARYSSHRLTEEDSRSFQIILRKKHKP